MNLKTFSVILGSGHTYTNKYTYISDSPGGGFVHIVSVKECSPYKIEKMIELTIVQRG